MSAWTLAAATSTRSVLSIELAGPQCRKATFRVDRQHPVGVARVVVTFDRPDRGNEMHARADAGRLYAMLCDTIGDLARDGAPLDVYGPALLGARVELHGSDALITAAPFFGVDTTANIIDRAEAWLTGRVAPNTDIS